MKNLFALAGFLLFTSLVSAQTIQDVSFTTRPDASPGVNLSSFIIQLTDSTQIDQIELGIGSTFGVSDLLNQSFLFDQTTGLSNGLSYSRNGNAVLLQAGAITEMPTYFGRVRLKLSNGQYTDYFSFTSN
jgi:archaellin